MTGKVPAPETERAGFQFCKRRKEIITNEDGVPDVLDLALMQHELLRKAAAQNPRFRQPYYRKRGFSALFYRFNIRHILLLQQVNQCPVCRK